MMVTTACSNLLPSSSLYCKITSFLVLTHCDRVTHICVSKLAIIGSDNGLSPGRRQVIISTNAGILVIGPVGTYFSEILIEIDIFSFKKMHLKRRLRNGGHFVSASMCLQTLCWPLIYPWLEQQIFITNLTLYSQRSVGTDV